METLISAPCGGASLSRTRARIGRRALHGKLDQGHIAEETRIEHSRGLEHGADLRGRATKNATALGIAGRLLFTQRRARLRGYTQAMSETQPPIKVHHH